MSGRVCHRLSRKPESSAFLAAQTLEEGSSAVLACSFPLYAASGAARPRRVAGRCVARGLRVVICGKAAGNTSLMQTPYCIDSCSPRHVHHGLCWRAAGTPPMHHEPGCLRSSVARALGVVSLRCQGQPRCPAQDAHHFDQCAHSCSHGTDSWRGGLGDRGGGRLHLICASRWPSSEPRGQRSCARARAARRPARICPSSRSPFCSRWWLAASS